MDLHPDSATIQADSYRHVYACSDSDCSKGSDASHRPAWRSCISGSLHDGAIGLEPADLRSSRVGPKYHGNDRYWWALLLLEYYSFSVYFDHVIHYFGAEAKVPLPSGLHRVSDLGNLDVSKLL